MPQYLECKSSCIGAFWCQSHTRRYTMLKNLEFTAYSTGYLKPYPTKPMLYARTEQQRIGTTVQPPGFQEAECYELRITLFTQFVANQAEYSRAKDQATRMMCSHLYSDILHRLHEVKCAVNNLELNTAQTLLDELQCDIVDSMIRRTK
jgi:hypothetical protein